MVAMLKQFTYIDLNNVSIKL